GYAHEAEDERVEAEVVDEDTSSVLEERRLDVVPCERAPAIDPQLTQERRHGLVALGVALDQYGLAGCRQRQVAQPGGVDGQVKDEKRERPGQALRGLAAEADALRRARELRDPVRGALERCHG